MPGLPSGHAHCTIGRSRGRQAPEVAVLRAARTSAAGRSLGRRLPLIWSRCRTKTAAQKATTATPGARKPAAKTTTAKAAGRTKTVAQKPTTATPGARKTAAKKTTAKTPSRAKAPTQQTAAKAVAKKAPAKKPNQK
jgi:hypothetical protein